MLEEFQKSVVATILLFNRFVFIIYQKPNPRIEKGDPVFL